MAQLRKLTSKLHTPMSLGNASHLAQRISPMTDCQLQAPEKHFNTMKLGPQEF